MHNADGSGTHGDEVPEGHSRAPHLIGEQASERTRDGSDQRSKEGDTHGNRRELRLEQQRERGRIADKRAEGPYIEPGYHPSVLALEDDQLILESRSRRGQVVHVAGGAEHRERDQWQPHKPRVLQVQSRRTLRRSHIKLTHPNPITIGVRN